MSGFSTLLRTATKTECVSLCSCRSLNVIMTNQTYKGLVLTLLVSLTSKLVLVDEKTFLLFLQLHSTVALVVQPSFQQQLKKSFLE